MKQKKVKEEVDAEAAKEKKKQLDMLQKKWISGITHEGAVSEPGEDFSVLSQKKPAAGEAHIIHVPPDEQTQNAPAKAAPAAQQADLDEIKEFIRTTIRLEIDRAVRELKMEIDQTSEASKKEILDELKMELERIKNEVELAQPPRKSRGLFDRF